jgi:Protein of unknown function (DUF3106)
VKRNFKAGMMAAASLMLAILLPLPSLGQRRNQESHPPARNQAPRNFHQDRPARQNARPMGNFQRQPSAPRSHSAPRYSAPRTYAQPGYQAPVHSYSQPQRGEVAHPPAYSGYSAQGRQPAPTPRYAPPAQREVPRPPVQNQHLVPQQNFRKEQQREVAHPLAQAPQRIATPASGLAQAPHEVPRPPQAGGVPSNLAPTRAVPRPPGPNGGAHIGDWVRTHRDMPAAEQQKALQSDPTFQKLGPQQQLRLQNQLTHLNNLPPQQQQRVLNRAEVWEHLSNEQRTQVKQLHSQMQALPPDRQRMMKTAIGDLRAMPPDQREKVLDSPRFQSMFSEHERNMLRETTKLPLAPADSVPRPPQN